MNQKPTPARLARQQQELAELGKSLPDLGPETPEQEADRKALWQQIRAELAQTRREKRLPIEKDLPDLWNYDSEQLLKELDGIREMILRIPATLDTRSALQSAIDRIWRLEQDVRYLMHLHREQQRAWARKHKPHEERTRKLKPAQAIRTIKA